MLDGGSGNDTAHYADAPGAVAVKLAIATAQTTLGGGVDKLIGIENLTGSHFDDTLQGDAGANRIDGAKGNDLLTGDAGNDTLVGGTGCDVLTGGLGADRFAYTSVGDSTPAYAGRDRIRDFSHAQGDRIDLRAIGSFTFVAGDAFTHHAGELIVTGAGGKWFVRVDVDGDGAADLGILVASATALTAADFVL